MSKQLEGKNALVTGGSSGIGRAAALAFAREGARVVVADVAVAGGEERKHRWPPAVLPAGWGHPKK